MGFSVIFLVGAVHGVILSVLLSQRSGNQLANRLLSLLMFIFSVDLAMAAAQKSGILASYPFFIGLDYPLTLLYGPVLYLYGLKLSTGSTRMTILDLVHGIPTILLLIYTVPLYVMPASDKVNLLSGNGYLVYGPEWVTNIKVGLNLLYLPFIIRMLKQFHARVEDSFSTIEKRNLDWLQRFIYAFLVLAVISVIIHLLNLFAENDPYSDLMLLAVTIFVFSIGYIGLSRAEFMALTAGEERIDQEKPIGEYLKSGLDEETGKELLMTLEQLMINEKPYLNSELSLRELASLMNISTHNLTEVINRLAGVNFYDFVNGYRVQETQHKLKSAEFASYTILAIGLESGFNSKSSFNSVFKRQVGMTPSEYKNRHL
ncbi:MAG: helix-turn-helix domain-containing protein [Bacteroidota bacterium]